MVFQNLVTYVAEFNQQLSSAFELVRNTAGVQHERQKYYDRNATNDSHAIDDLVWVLSNSDHGIPVNRPTTENTVLPADRPQAPLPSLPPLIGELVDEDEDNSAKNQHVGEFTTTNHSLPVTETRRYTAHQRRPQ